jgi:hypothetical protein
MSIYDQHLGKTAANFVALSPVSFVERRNLQIVQNCRPVQLRELAHGRSFDVHPALHTFALKEGLGVSAFEVSDRHVAR